MEQKKNRTLFYIINGVILILLLVFIMQNRQEVFVKFLGLQAIGPAFMVYVILFALGFFVGWLWKFFYFRSKK